MTHSWVGTDVLAESTASICVFILPSSGFDHHALICCVGTKNLEERISVFNPDDVRSVFYPETLVELLQHNTES